ncbi:MAG: HEAT repeat domain-containing protein [Myxococcales bacterium]
MAPLVERVLRKAVPTRVQRMGSQALERVAQRFPALKELLETARARLERQQRAPATPTTPPNGTAATHGPVLDEPSASRPTISFEALVASMADPNWHVRADTANRLAELQAEGVAELLHRALRDESAEVAAAAAVSLSRHGTPRALAALREVLENRDGYFSPVTRAACVHGLARCVDAASAGPVLDVVQDVDAEVSIAAILAITERVPELATPRLLSVLSDDTSYFLPLVRLAAANALTKLGTLTQDTLNNLLHTETDGEVRRVLEGALLAN